jgi:homoaconitase/3-isopropylmalate dehydratase large subunit
MTGENHLSIANKVPNRSQFACEFIGNCRRARMYLLTVVLNLIRGKVYDNISQVVGPTDRNNRC